MTAYTIQINEYQRKLIAQVLRMAADNIQLAEVLIGQPGENEETAFEEVRDLEHMLLDAPRYEEANPGMIHGFCL